MFLILGIGPMPVIGYGLMAFFVLALPLNVYSVVNGTGLGAKGVEYLWFRVPLQFFWLWWVCRFVVRGSGVGEKKGTPIGVPRVFSLGERGLVRDHNGG